jgi:molybdopterin-guanine dinucleotide biosynthesis protein
MKIVSVLGTASNTGKTTVASYIIRSLLDCTPSVSGESVRARRLGALKITVRHEGVCPRHLQCDTCDKQDTPFKVITGDEIIKEEGKDTACLLNSGADKVVWLQTDSIVEGEGIKAALGCFDKDNTLIVEGNSLLRVRDADVSILVATPSVKKMKRSAKLLLNRIDIVAINMHGDDGLEQMRECKKEMGDFGSRTVPFYMINPCKDNVYSNKAFIQKIWDSLYR